MTGAAKGTVLKLLTELGAVCAEYQEKALRDLPCRRLQCDEIWSFVGMKDKNVPAELRGQAWIGDVYTWTAICADTKLVPCWRVGRRTAVDAQAFIQDLAERLACRVQLTTDGHSSYINAVHGAFGSAVDFAQLVKTYGMDLKDGGETRYSPPKINGARKQMITGRPRPSSRLHELRRAPEPHHANADATLHSADQRLFPRRSRTCGRPSPCTS